MAQSVSAIVARSSEVDETLAKAFDARRERIAEMARQRVDPNAVRGDRPQPAAQVETARAVSGATAAAASRPNLSPEVRSMLMSPGQSSAPSSGSKSSTVLIGQLLDALRQYEKNNAGA
ncbi:MAG: hypothetical protein MRY74_16170 [Neomegalonema sp.]|nr:hypothetical protein [Neomegalonema sp.]